MITIEHTFKDKCPDLNEIFHRQDETPIVTVDSFCARLDTLSDKYQHLIDPNDFKGWGLELLTEFLIKENGSDNRIGIYDYQPASDDVQKDVGVDGIGKGENSKPATVQVKYRQYDYVLKANEDHLSNFVVSSVMDYGVDKDDDKNMLIVTSGQDVHHFTMSEMLKNKVRVLNRAALKQMLDNRSEWWNRFKEATIAARINELNEGDEVNEIVLREHQSEAVDAVFEDDNMKGMVILPTGTGKTIIEAEIVLRKIKELQDAGNRSPIIKVNSSRILLCFQLFEEFHKYFSSKGLDARYVNFNSGKKSDSEFAREIRKHGGIYRQITSTTTPVGVNDAYAKSQQEDIPLVVFSTYHSSENFANCGLVPDLTIHDEAHNLVSESFFNASRLESKGDIYFTATMKTSDTDEGIGMNNKEHFDNVIYSKSSQELIRAGEMVPPCVHLVSNVSEEIIDDSNYNAMFSSIVEAFFVHEKKIKEDSVDSDKIGAKVLVVCRNQEDLKQMIGCEAFEKFKAGNPDIHMYALSSDFGLYNDGEMIEAPVTNMKKHNLIKSLKNLGHNERSIIFHVDMIGEGIDVPSITGVMPFRNCELAKFIQNVGRSTRLHSIDRMRLYNGEIEANNKEDFIKPFSWIIVPSFLTSSEQYESRFQEIVKRLRDEFGYIPSQITHLDSNGGLEEDEEIDPINTPHKGKCKKKNKPIEFKHDFENLDWATRIKANEMVNDKVNDIIKDFIG